MTTRYCDLTKPQKLALSGDEFANALKIEAIQRGIKPPITLDSVLNQSGYKGWTIPSESAVFHEICVPQGAYTAARDTGLAFRTAEEARAALKNVFFIKHDNYPQRITVESGEAEIREVHITLKKPVELKTVLEQFEQDDSEFDKLEEELRKDWSGTCQEAYNHRVQLTKRAEYMRLAGGDETIARAFWAKTEGAEFPTAE